MNPPDNLPSAQPGGRARLRRWLRWAEHLLAGIGAAFLVFHLGFEYTVMTSDSMSPTLQGTTYENGDRILLEKVSGWFRAPRRWEIYHFYDAEGNPVAKRLVGLPGEKIAIRTNVIYINGRPIDRPSALQGIQYFGYGTLAHGREVDCAGGYFALGDSSVDSFDSRFTGLVAPQRLRGRVWCVVWPFSRIQWVK